MTPARGLFSNLITFVSLLQPEYFTLKYSVLFQFESYFIVDVYY